MVVIRVESVGPISTTALSTRRPRGINPKGGKMQQMPRRDGFKLPEYLEMVEVNTLIAAAPNSRARLIMLEQCRAGLRVSEALALEVLDSDRPTLVYLELAPDPSGSLASVP
jgi:integrase